MCVNRNNCIRLFLFQYLSIKSEAQNIQLQINYRYYTFVTNCMQCVGSCDININVYILSLNNYSLPINLPIIITQPEQIRRFNA